MPQRRTAHLALQVLAIQLGVTVVLAAAGMLAVWVGASQAVQRQVVLAASRAVDEVAQDPEVLAALASDDPVGGLRGPINRLRTANQMTFITVTDLHGTRLAHPNDAQIGKKFIGDISGALNGQRVAEEIVGTYGPLMQVNGPIRGPDGTIVAVVSAGLEASTVRTAALEASGTLLLVVGGAGIIAVGLALWFGRRVNRQTHGLSAGQIARLWGYHRALLASVTQGMILISEEGTIQLINGAARRLLGVDDDAHVTAVADLGLRRELTTLMSTGRTAAAEVYSVGPRVLMVTQTPAEPSHGGWLVTLQDSTELLDLANTLGSERASADALRARVHDADNQLHTVVSMIELGEPHRAAELVASRMGRTQATVDHITSVIHSPALAALLVAKARLGHDQGVEVTVVAPEPVSAEGLNDVAIISLVGNLVDNAIEAALDAPEPRWVEVTLIEGARLTIEVSDSGPGVAPELREAIFTKGWTTKAGSQEEGAPSVHGFGLVLAQAAAARLGAHLELERSSRGTLNLFRVVLPLVQEQPC